MSTVSLVLLGLCAIIVQSSVVIVARHFLDVHHERPLSTIGRMVIRAVNFISIWTTAALFAFI